MITVIAEHSVDLDLLPEKAKVLDLGCRGFLFADEIERLGHSVIPVDCDDVETSRPYFKMAVTNYDGVARVFDNKDPQGINIKRGDKSSSWDVEAITLKSLSHRFNIDFWDLIKLDIEGSEYEVIMSLDKAPAKQLSIEFHLHTGIYGYKEVVEMQAKLESLGYETVSHEMTSQHGCGMNYWDSLFILK